MPAMSEEVADIQWGTKLVSASKLKDLYSSFVSEGIEYKLYDNVQVYDADNEEPFIGKIMKLWEEKRNRVKKVLIRWFLRLRDLDPQLKGDSRELFLAFGKGRGVTNENDLEVVCGKSNVLCTSTDARNKQPSDNDIKNADFYFSKIYNVDLHHVSPLQKVVDKLGCEVVFNKVEWVSEFPKDMKEQYEQPNSPPVPSEIVSKREVEFSQSLSNVQKEVEGDVGQKVSQVSVLKRNQVSSITEDPKKRLKNAAAALPQELVETIRLVEAEQNFASPPNDAAWTETLKVDVQKVQSKPNTPACGPQLIDPKVNIPCALPAAVDMDGHPVQKKKSTACGHAQTRTLGNLSFKRMSSAEIISSSRHFLGFKRSSKGQSLPVSQCLAGADNAPECAVLMGPRISNQGAETNTKPKMERISLDSTLRDSSKGKELLPEIQSNFNKPLDLSFCLTETSTVNLKTIKSKVEVEAELTAKLLSLDENTSQNQANFSPLPDPKRFAQDSATKDKDPSINKKWNVGTRSETQKQSVSEIEHRRKVEKWKMFKELSWEDHLQHGLRFGKVVLLQNLDPNTTSTDILDMLRNILQGVSDVQIIPQKTDCPYGQALAVFDTRLFADSALQEMEKNHLVSVIDERPIIATKFKAASNLTKFPGHLALDQLRLNGILGPDHYEKTVSTSHLSQPNTIEYEMAMEWRRLQQITQACRAELFKEQNREAEEMRAKL